MTIVVPHARVVAAHNADDALDGPTLDRFQQRVERAAQGLDNGFDAEARHAFSLVVGDVDHALVAVGIVFHGLAHDAFGNLVSVLFVELDVRGARELGLGRGRDDLGVETAGQFWKCREDALDVYDHGLYRAGDDRELLLQKVAGYGDAVAHQHLVACAAHAGHGDALCPLLSGQFDHLWILARRHNHLRQGRLVAMDDDVDFVFLQHAQVRCGLDRLRGAKQHVGQFGGDHRSTPAIADGSSQAVEDEVDGIVVHAYVGTVHRFHDLTVHTTRVHAQLLPQFDAFGRRAPGEADGPFLVAKLGIHCPCQIQGDLLRDTPLGRNLVFGRQGVQFRLVLDLITSGFAFCRQQQSVGNVPAVVRVGCGAGRDHAQQAAGDDGIGRGPTDSLGRTCIAKRIDAAGTHGTMAAAEAQLTVAALGFLCLESLPGRLISLPVRNAQHVLGCWIE